jgi:hypothetical protein
LAPNRSSSQLESNPAWKGADRPLDDVADVVVVVVWLLNADCGPVSEAEALPVSDGPSAASASRRVARASRILALALATSALPATASAISSSSNGSLKARHHASSEAAGVDSPRPSTAPCVHCAGSAMSGFA